MISPICGKGTSVALNFCFLQELGACSGATPEVQVSDFQLGSSLYTLYLCSSPEAHLSQAILVHSSLGFHATHKCGLPVGLVVHGACHNHRIHLACLHLPHSKRAGSEHKPRATSEEVWQESLEKTGCRSRGGLSCGLPHNRERLQSGPACTFRFLCGDESFAHSDPYPIDGVSPKVIFAPKAGDILDHRKSGVLCYPVILDLISKITASSSPKSQRKILGSQIQNHSFILNV